MKKNKKLCLAVLAALGMNAGVQAQTGNEVVIDKPTTTTPYVIDNRGVVARSGANLCWRTGTWTLDGARNTKVVGSAFPVGCFCEKDLLPRSACEAPPPAPVAAAPAPAPAPAAPPPPAPAPVPAPLPTPAAEKVSIPADALFEFDRATLTPQGREALVQFANQAKSLKLETVIGTGHADRIGTEQYNQALSQRRVDTVRDFLVGQGVEANRILVEAKGESQPVTGDRCANMGRESGSNRRLVECLAPDRRVELEAIGTR